MSASHTTSGTAATRGPWKILRRPRMSIEGFVHIVSDAEGHLPMAFIPAWVPEEPNDVDGREEALANARLIAAAPELYEFAAALDASWTAMIPSGPDGGDEFLDLAEEHKTLWRMCRAALSKANGEQA